MKTLAGCVVLTCVLAIPFRSSFAQISIDAADVASRYAVGTTISEQTDSITAQLNIGSTGGGNFWDFSALISSGVMAWTSVTVPSTPPSFSALFPGSTHSLKASGTITISGIQVTATLYRYFLLGQNLLYPGGAGSGTILGIIPGEIKVINRPSDTMYALPIAPGINWSSTYDQDTLISAPGIYTRHDTTRHTVSHVVDADGQMKMPGGVIYRTLRIRVFDSTAAGKHVSYEFLSKEGALVRANACDPNGPSSGAISVCGGISWVTAGPADVAVSKGIPDAYALLQNYPNPFNPTTGIRYQVPGVSDVKLAVYDLLGREVAVLVKERKEPGNYTVQFNASGLASGVYVYRLEAGGFVASKKLVLVR
jgi:Secretion system C-terminal sorting domain